MNVEMTSNMKTVDELVEFIRDRVQRSNKRWWEIAVAFAEAKEMYGVGSDLFKSLCTRTEFGISKAQKLAAIAGSERLRKYAVQLSSVHSWGTLYAIETLDDDKFEELVNLYKLNDKSVSPPFISQQMVEKLKKGKKESSSMKNYAVIQIDEDALKGELIGGDELQELYRFIAEIDNITPYVRVSRSEIDDKYEWFWMTRIEEKAKRMLRKAFGGALDARLKQRKRAPQQSQKDFEIKCFSMSRAEMMQMFDENAEEACKYLGIEYEYPKYFAEAQVEISALSDKYARKAIAKPKHEPLPKPLSKEEEAEQDRLHQEKVDRMLSRNKPSLLPPGMFMEKESPTKAA